MDLLWLQFMVFQIPRQEEALQEEPCDVTERSPGLLLSAGITPGTSFRAWLLHCYQWSNTALLAALLGR